MINGQTFAATRSTEEKTYKKERSLKVHTVNEKLQIVDEDFIRGTFTSLEKWAAGRNMKWIDLEDLEKNVLASHGGPIVESKFGIKGIETYDYDPGLHRFRRSLKEVVEKSKARTFEKEAEAEMAFDAIVEKRGGALG